MRDSDYRAVAIVGVGAVLPDAPNAAAFWENVKNGRYSISEVPRERWDPEVYYDPDPDAPDKSYSKIGGWVREYDWDPMKWRLPIPPKIGAAMDRTQKWAVLGARQALSDYGYPDRPLNEDRTAVILGNAMAGEFHYISTLRILFPEYVEELTQAPSFAALPAEVREAITAELRQGVSERFPEITEDTMPGELANIIAGRVANLFNFHGPNYVVDAACASAMAAITAAVEGLAEGDYDAVITGGIDSNMGPSTYTKFCKIGALSATGTRPYADGADGFVMGEGAALFLIKRLVDAEKAGDRIYAVLRGMGGSSDGKGKGITAPNPIGQKLAVKRAWQNAGIAPDLATMIEGHGTSTRVGDVVEVESLAESFGEHNLPAGSLPLGSVKSNIGHLKGAAGAAGILKAALALRDKVLPPSLNFERPNPNIDFERAPFRVNTELRPWDVADGQVRTAGVSAFGFGGTNFHAVLEEFVPGRLGGNGRKSVSVGEVADVSSSPPASSHRKPPRGALVVGAPTEGKLRERLVEIGRKAKAGEAPVPALPSQSDLAATFRVAIDYGDAAELADRVAKAVKAMDVNHAGMWRALRAQGIFRGQGPAPKAAFLYTGQGSQYVNMLAELRGREPIVAECFAEADRVMTPLLGRPLSDFVFCDSADPAQVKEAEEALRQTAITQPAVLAADYALTALLGSFGIQPDMVMGHSLGEYGALVASGGLPFADALEAVSARGREMTKVSVEDNGWMAAVFAPLKKIERVLETVDGYVVVANINSNNQAVIGGASAAVEQAIAAFQKDGVDARRIPVSHAFHTSIVSPASGPLRQVLERLRLQPPRIPIVANVSGEFYPMRPDATPEMLDILAKQVAAPVQFVKGLNTLYEAGARVFVEVGPKKALFGFVEDVLGDRDDVSALFTNHPKIGDMTSFNHALCGLYASGLGNASARPETAVQPARVSAPPPEEKPAPAPPAAPSRSAQGQDGSQRYLELGRLFAEFLEKGQRIYSGGSSSPGDVSAVVSGAAMGLPGSRRVFDDANVERMMRGEQFIDSIPSRFRTAMVEKHITRLVKTDQGGPRFEVIDRPSEAIKLAGRGGTFDLVEEYGFPEERLPALDIVTRMAIAVGLDALRDAGIPLVMRYKTTTRGTFLPDRWMLPEPLRDETGIIFAAAFPGMDSFAEDCARFHQDRQRRARLEDLEAVWDRLTAGERTGAAGVEIKRRIDDLKVEIERDPYALDRRFLFRALAMGHSQFAEYIGARGPNTHVNAACASTTQALSIAEDWIRGGRCRRVVVISADDVTSDNLLEWIGAGFLATGAAATDDVVEEAALPFDRRRHGMILGMGAAALVVEAEDAVRERGMRPICEVLGSITANSAYHGTRLDVEHICHVMDAMISDAERRWGVSRLDMAPETLFVSHETYTPARGGSAQAEVDALRHVFGAAADQIVVANTKGYTGHAMGAGVEDVLAVKSLETGLVPPVANFKEVDPELGRLNLSKGGAYPVRYALRLGAGFGSQISMSLIRWTPTPDGVRPSPRDLGYEYRVADVGAWKRWLSHISGHPEASLEVVRRTLRVVDRGPAAMQPAATPSIAASAPPSIAASAPRPEPSQPVAPAPAAPETPPVQPPPPADDPIQGRILSLVSEVTGYPPDMLDMDLDLEADLGIDTVKQAEMFASIREAYDIPRDDSLKLREFPTLTHVLKFVHDRRPDLAQPSAPPAAAAGELSRPTSQAPTPQAAPASDTAAGAAAEVTEKVLGIVSQVTGYPSDMLDLDLDLEADLGIDTVKQAETFASIREAFNIERDENLQLRQFPTLKHVLEFVYDKRPELAGERPAPDSQPPVPEVSPAVVEQAPGGDLEVTQKVLSIVSEVTGYPSDMLDLDLDLEADLGIDTVKQAETFASIRQAFDIPRDDALQLREFPTLNHVLQFVYDRKGGRPTPDSQPSTAPEAASAPSVESPEASDEVTEKVLSIVSEVTGYPSDMLEMDQDLEADLGIDTVKQAETFASVRQAFGIERDENLQLRDFPTLNHVLQFVYDKRPDLKTGTATTPTATVSPEPEPSPSAPPLEGSLEAAVAIPHRAAVSCVRPDLNFFQITGVTLDADSRVVVMLDQGGVGKALVGRLEKMGAAVLEIDGAPDTAELDRLLEAWLADGPIQGVFWLPALDFEGDLFEIPDLGAWREALRVRIKLLYSTMRKLYQNVDKPGTFLVSATRLGGRHGYDSAGARAPLGGAVAGFTKAYKRERPEALVKAVDFEISRKTAALADLLIEETLRDPGVVEVGYQEGMRWTVGLEEQPPADGQPGMDLGNDSVFLVTGAAGSIVSAIVGDLASASGGVFYLLDLAPEPDRSNPDLQRLSADREGLKRDLFERIKARGDRATPALVEKELAALERSQAALAAIRSVERSGGKAHYVSLDLTDPQAVKEAVALVRKQSGRIDVLLHAAGLEISRALPDKPPAEFDLVFDVKSDGWFNLLHGIGDMPVAAAVVFSSIAGRFGNGGQTDYSAANDLLCKTISSFRNNRPETRGIAIDWTAWRDIGMASRGSIPKMMELAGIDMLAPEAGIPVVRRTLTSGAWSGEAVIGGRLGILEEELAEAGGLDRTTLQNASVGPMLSQAVAVGPYSGLTVEAVLDPAQQPFLHDHRIDGIPVLPGVMGIEAFAEAAQLLFPDWRLAGIEDVRFLAPFKFYRDEPRTVTVNAVFRPLGEDLTAQCRLIGHRQLPGQTEPQSAVHFTAQVRLSRKPVEGTAGQEPPQSPGREVNSEDIYRIYFHGPAYRVLERAWRAEDGKVVGLMSDSLPANHQPEESPVAMAPRLIELCFQTAGIWEMGTTGKMGLPQRVQRVRLVRSPEAASGRQLFAVVTPHQSDGYEASVVDETGSLYVQLLGYQTVALPGGVEAEKLAPLEAAMKESAEAVAGTE